MKDTRSIKKVITLNTVTVLLLAACGIVFSALIIDAKGSIEQMPPVNIFIMGLVDGSILTTILALIIVAVTKIIKYRNRLNAKEYELKYRSIVDLSGDIVFEWNNKDRKLIMNDKWGETFGEKKLFESDGKLAYRYFHPDDRSAMTEFVDCLCNKGEAEPVVVRIADKYGKYAWVRLRATVIQTGDEKSVCGTITDVTDETERRRALEKRAQRDGLTGLLNVLAGREAINSRLEFYEKGEGKTAFVMFDVDSFKSLNDTYGHPFGDKVLVAMANCMKNTFRRDDVKMRLGGDEFIVYAEHIKAKDFMNRKCDEFRRTWNENLHMTDETVNVSCSFGIAYAGEDGYSFDELYSAADSRMYESKHER